MHRFVRVLLAAGVMASAGFAQVDWTSRSPQPSAFRFNKMACSPKLCVVVGDEGVMFNTADGRDWKKVPNPVGAEWQSVSWSGTRFVAIGAFDLAYSDDGKNWTNHHIDSQTQFWGLLGGGWVGSQFIALSNFDSVMTSPNGQTWNAVKIGCNVYGMTPAIAVHGATALVGFCRSDDSGRTWVSNEASFAVGGDSWGMLSGVIWDGSRFLAAISAGIISSPDGLTWTPELLGGTWMHAVAGDTNSAVAVNGAGIWHRNANATWTLVDSSALGQRLTEVGKLASGFVAVGDPGVVATSPDGLVWTISDPGRTLWDVTFANSQYLAVGDAGTLRRSLDGISWTSVVAPTGANLRSVATDGTRSVVVGDSGCALVSQNGTAWSRVDVGSKRNLKSVIWDGVRFMAVGDSGLILLSSDGSAWTSQSITTSGLVRVVGFAGGAPAFGGKYVLDDSGYVWQWDSPKWLKGGPRLNGMTGLFASGDSLLLGVDTDGKFWRCAIGTNWASASGLWFDSPTIAVRTTTQWVGVNAMGEVATSQNGLDWGMRSGGLRGLNAMVANNGLLVAVGINGQILTSPEVAPLPVGVRPTAAKFAVRAVGGNLLVRPVASGRLQVTLRDLGGRQLVTKQFDAVMGQELSVSLPDSRRALVLSVVQNGAATSQLLAGSLVR